MKQLSFYLILILSLTSINLPAQKNVNQDNFTEIVGQEEGDLNQDKIADKIIITANNNLEIRPFKLQIFLSQANSKKLKEVVSTSKILEPQYDAEKYGMKKNFRIPDVFIENGNLTILTDIDELKSRYIFRFKNGNFELTNISRVIWDGKETTTETEIDLIKGTKEIYDQDFGPSKKFKLKQKTTPKALPKIQDLTFSDLEKY